MMAEIKGAVLLLCCLMFFTLICALAALGMVMRPNRWSERKTTAS